MTTNSEEGLESNLKHAASYSYFVDEGRLKFSVPFSILGTVYLAILIWYIGRKNLRF